MIHKYGGFELTVKKEDEGWRAHMSDGTRTGLHVSSEAAIAEAKKWIDAKPPRRS